tara:strand:- start:1091 stop:1660 length:570 start_codon:yes stop_codon:yes gene_type:complete
MLNNEDENDKNEEDKEKKLIRSFMGLVPNDFQSKVWGYEMIIDDSPYYHMKSSYIHCSASSSAHFHKDRVETIYITKGGLSLSIGTPKDDTLWRNMNKYDHNYPDLLDADAKGLLPLDDQWNWSTVLLSEGMRYRINPFELHWVMGNFIMSPTGCHYTEVSNIHYEKDIYRLVSSTCDPKLIMGGESNE